MTDSPVRPYRTIITDSGNNSYINRVLVGVPCTGLVRVEWYQARVGQMIPMNWSQVEVVQFMNSYMPLRYQVADAQNLIVRRAIELDFEWLLLWEHDVCPPPDALSILNRHMRNENVPVVSGLYYSRSRPSEPLIFRGRGTSVHTDFKQGDLVWCDGVPTGFLLIHMGLIRAMWDESEEYVLNTPGGPATVRRVFNTPRDLWRDPETGWVNTTSGTSDLDWCTKVIDGGYFKKAGWDRFQDMRYPFLVDTNISCVHINPDGERFP